MDIGSIIKNYRDSIGMSLRDFASKCGASHSYIAMLESGKNSKTGEPIIPTISMLKKIASGLGISVNDLIAMCDDMPVSLGMPQKEKSPEEPKLPEEEEELLKLIRLMPAEMKSLYIETLRATLKGLGLI